MINWHAGFSDGRFLWIEWHFWKVIGWLGNVVFFSRFIVQWLATEKHKRVVVPSAFWWLSLIGTLLLLSYALFARRDSVFIFAYAFSWIPYRAQPDHPSAAQTGASGMSGLRHRVSPRIELLFRVRDAIGGIGRSSRLKVTFSATPARGRWPALM